MRHRRTIAMGAALLALVLVLCGIFAGRREKLQSTVLADGSVLRLEKVTFGTNHVFSKSSRLRSILSRIASRTGKVLYLANPSVTVNTHQPAFVLWFTQETTGTNKFVPPKMTSVQVVDEHGCILGVIDRGYGSGSGPKQVRFWKVTTFPRRQREFLVNVYDSAQPLGQFTIQNDQPLPAESERRAPPLPVSVQEGNVTVRLRRISHSPADLGLRRYYYPEFTFEEDSIKSKRWLTGEIEWSDRTGNVVDNSSALCEHEPIWRLQTTLYRSPLADIAPDCVWQTESFKVPGAGEFIVLLQSNTVQGAAITVLGAAGPGVTTYSNDVPVRCVAQVVRSSSLSVRSTGPVMSTEHAHLAIRERLTRNQRVDFLLRHNHKTESMSWQSGSGDLRFYPLRVPAGETVELFAVVQTERPLRFEFQPPKPKK